MLLGLIDQALHTVLDSRRRAIFRHAAASRLRRAAYMARYHWRHVTYRLDCASEPVANAIRWTSGVVLGCGCTDNDRSFCKERSELCRCHCHNWFEDEEHDALARQDAEIAFVCKGCGLEQSWLECGRGDATTACWSCGDECGRIPDTIVDA